MKIEKHKIMQDAVELFSGSETGIKVVFNNLTGRNFGGDGDKHQQYLAWLSNKVGLAIVPERLRIEVEEISV